MTLKSGSRAVDNVRWAADGRVAVAHGVALTIVTHVLEDVHALAAFGAMSPTTVRRPALSDADMAARRWRRSVSRRLRALAARASG